MATDVLEIDSIITNQYEPKRKNRWVMEIDGEEAFFVRTTSRPSFSVDEHLIDYLNLRRKLAGKVTWEDITITLYDPIAPSSAQKFTEWARLQHDAVSGRQGYRAIYQKTLKLKGLDPTGAVVEQWELVNTWLKSVNFGDIDHSTGDPIEISCVIAFDYAIHNF